MCPDPPRRAIAELVGRGVLVRKRGVCTQVVRGRIDRQVKLSSLFDDLARTQQHPKTRVLINEVTPGSDEVCARLRLPRRHPVLHLRRVRLVGDEPLAILENYLPDQVGAAAGGIGGGTGGGIGAADLTAVGLYRAMREAGVRMCVAKQHIAAREGTREECELLGEPFGSPLLTMERLTHDDSGRAVEWARHAYRPDRYAFTVTLVGR